MRADAGWRPYWPGPFQSEASGATAPQGAIAPGDERQTVGVARHALVLRQLELLLGLVPALSGLTHLFHFRGGVPIQRQDVFCVVLGAEPAVRLSGVARDQTIPIQRQDFGDEGFGFEREEVDHAAARKRTNRDGVDDENDLFLGSRITRLESE